MKKILFIVVPLVVLAMVAGGVWWFVLRNDPKKAAGLPDRPTVTTNLGGGTAAAGDATVPTTADGTWVVQPGPDVFAGYRVQEQFGGDAIKKTAVGRSAGVTGTLVVAGAQVPTAGFQVDMTQLASDSTRRDGQIKDRGLETAKFPTATFTLTKPIELAAPSVAGTPVDAQATGDLVLHGVTKSVTIPVTARWNGDSIDVAGSLPIAMADYSIEPPSVGGFVSVDGNGTLEFQLTFVKA